MLNFQVNIHFQSNDWSHLEEEACMTNDKIIIKKIRLLMLLYTWIYNCLFLSYEWPEKLTPFLDYPLWWVLKTKCQVLYHIQTSCSFPANMGKRIINSASQLNRHNPGRALKDVNQIRRVHSTGEARKAQINTLEWERNQIKDTVKNRGQEGSRSKANEERLMG